MEPQQRRPRPDLGCSAIGWIDGPIDEVFRCQQHTAKALPFLLFPSLRALASAKDPLLARSCVGLCLYQTDATRVTRQPPWLP
jgi:hypothetical protein